MKDELVIVGSGIKAATWRIVDARQRTLKAINNLPDGILDWHTTGHPNSISTLLYHIAAIEADWLFVEVLGEGFEKVEALFPYEVRDESGRLTVIDNMSLNEHLKRLNTVRQHLLEAYHTMDEAYYKQQREMPNYFVTPDWVIHHLCQHEAEHRGEIMIIRSLYEASFKVE